MIVKWGRRKMIPAPSVRKTIPILKSENDPHINFGQIQKRKMTPIFFGGNNLKESDPQTGNGCHTKTQLYKNDLYNFYL